MTNWFRRSLAWLMLTLLLPAAAWSQGQDPAHWRPDIDAFTAHDRIAPPPRHGVLFIGSSSIHNWSSVVQDFPGVPVINRGFGGSVIADSTYYADRIVTPYHPRLIVFYAGDNDVFEGHAAAQVLADFQAFVARVRQGQPGVPVAYVSIKPSVARIALWPTMHAANEAIRRWAATQKDVRFVDIGPAMLDAQGRPRPELFREDGLHMKPAGYAIWIAALKPVLAEYGFRPN